MNGDGYAEVAVGEPGDLVRRGAVHVLYGAAGGLATDYSATALNHQWFAKGAEGVPGAATHHDDFGLAVAFGDFNGDGCADLAIDAPGANATEDPPGKVPPSGDVTVLYGSPQGITSTGAQSFSLGSMFAGQVRRSERFGAAIATGDLNGDGIDDLAMGAPYANLSGAESELDRNGAVAVAFGSPVGLDRGGIRGSLITQDTPGVPGAVFGNERFGAALAIADFDGDGAGELAIGAPGGTIGDEFWAGAIYQVSHVTGGSAPVSATMIDQNSTGVPGAGETNDEFGTSLAAGDVTGDGRADLAVGVPAENRDQGAVVLLRGSAQGLTGAGAQRWTQASRGVSGAPRRGDHFGLSLVMAPLDADRYADLAVGAPADSLGDAYQVGSVTVLRGSADGLTTSGFGGVRLTADTAGIAGIARTGSGFGVAVTAARVQGTDPANLVIGSASALSGDRFGGLINQLGRTDRGPQPASSRVFGQHTRGVGGTAADGDAFGWSVS